MTYTADPSHFLIQLLELLLDPVAELIIDGEDLTAQVAHAGRDGRV